MPDTMDPGQARALALLQAMGPMQEAGLQRSASPAGAIAKNLIPLFGAMIQGKLMEQQMAMQQKLLEAKLAKAGVDPELKAAKIKQLEALTAQEQSLAEERRSKGSYRDKLLQQVEGLTSGAGGQAPGGMKPTITMGPGGPSVSYRSDVMSPEALQQRKEIQAAGVNQTLEREKSFYNYKRENPAITQAQMNALEAGKSLMTMLDEIPQAVETIPKDMSRGEIARNAAKYQGRSEHPIITNMLTGMTGGLISADSDPRLDKYFSTVGQGQAALAAFNLAGLRGGYRTLQWLQAHFPGWADDPATAARKAEFLKSNKGIVQQKVTQLQEMIKNSAAVAKDVGGEPMGDTVRLKIRNKKTGQEQYIEYDPATGSTSVPQGNAD